MDFKAFRTALFGYSRMDVCAYISDMTAEFTKLMLQNNARYESEIASLNVELERLRAIGNDYFEQKQQINQTLMDARAHADRMIHEVEEDVRSKRVYYADEFERQRSRVLQYSKHFDSLYTAFRSMLTELDSGLDDMRKEFQEMSQETLASEPALPRDTERANSAEEADCDDNEDYDDDSNDPILEALPSLDKE